ncbi:hypothetical protein FD755_016213 [Muntiacus reevesi]|uniref:Immunoglobulin V-set domain-containing protein n=1 Tax=Muntiacus reevesi TaxID=9886 RepID=A0A5N3W1F1_MUNRE|nr:hypothetical protein FD755_023139 [Muntiacus reevesi]KAB0372421.1 hypothetical protein FD755_016213 [Muntiacus reevesi]
MEKLLALSLVILWLQLASEFGLLTLSIQEGENITMNCSYKSITLTALQQKYSGRQHFTLDNSIKSCFLSIMGSQAEDAATYLCAADPQCSAGTRSPSTNLPELSLRSRNSVQSWWFVFPQRRVCKRLATQKGAPLKFLIFSVACQTIAKGVRFRTGN